MYNAAIRSSTHSVSTKSHIDDVIIPFSPIHEGHRHLPLFSAILFFRSITHY